MSRQAKKIIRTVLIIAAIVALAGFYLWNKPHKNVLGTDGIQTEATALYKAFISDSVAAKKSFLQQVVQVKGVINNISKNQQGQTIVTLKTGTEGAYINCTMEGEIAGAKEGSAISVKGICEGIGQGDADMGIAGDVYLIRCYQVK